MHRALLHRPVGQWPEELASDAVTLDFEGRHRRRIRLCADLGEEILLELPRAVAMGDGDGLQLEDGRWLRVQAAAEDVVEVSHKDALQLMRIAWHLGNRHTPTEIRHHRLRIRPDHVIEAMLSGLGAELARFHAPFQPEVGAYSNHEHGALAGHHHG